MQANKESSYSSPRDSAYTGSYNTKLVLTQLKIVASEDKPMQCSCPTQHATRIHTTPCGSRARDDAFDFAGIAG